MASTQRWYPPCLTLSVPRRFRLKVVLLVSRRPRLRPYFAHLEAISLEEAPMGTHLVLWHLIRGHSFVTIIQHHGKNIGSPSAWLWHRSFCLWPCVSRGCLEATSSEAASLVSKEP